MKYQNIIDFWFSEQVRKNWWIKDTGFDEEIRQRFGECHHLACTDAYLEWRSEPEGRLAEIIVLDQFSRNLFRNNTKAYAQDSLARGLCREAIDCGADRNLSPVQRSFLYMPLMHSESPQDHADAMKLYASHPELASNLGFEKRHKTIIDRFGRYPHRNRELGRESTEEERLFLQQDGSSF
jgi:uncharacterized protein (DUF924 family)